MASQAMLFEAEKVGLEVAWDRYQAQLPLCGFGELGTCCRNCMQGPCRIDPFGEGPQLGACGATADTIVARNLDRAIAGGTAAHSGHAKHLAHTLLKAARGEAPDYGVKDEAKLMAVAARLGLDTEGQSVNDVAETVAEAALAWAATTVTQGRVETFLKLGVVPTGIDSAISEIMHRVETDPVAAASKLVEAIKERRAGLGQSA